MTSRSPIRVHGLRALLIHAFLLLTLGTASAHGESDTVERPADIWGYLREAAAAENAYPDRTISYDGAHGRQHRIEVFYPAGSTGGMALPGLVLFHGGAWREGSPIQFYRQARNIANTGFVVALPEYSTRDEDGTSPRESLEDAFQVWSTIRSLTDDLCIASDVLFAGGASAGGQLAAALATVAPPPSLTRQHQAPAGLVLFNPVIDNGPDGYGHSRVRSYWREFSPLHNIGEAHPPTLILVGDSDPLLPVQTAETYCSRVRNTGSDCVLTVFPNAGHAWFNYDPAGYSGTLEATIAFLGSSVKKAAGAQPCPGR